MSKPSFITPEQFEELLTLAKKGSITARNKIYSHQSEKQARIHLKDEYEDLAGEVFLCFCEALEKYDLDKMPDKYQHVFWFSRYFKHRLRFALQTHRRLTQHPVSLSAHAIRNKVELKIVDYYRLNIGVEDTNLATLL